MCDFIHRVRVYISSTDIIGIPISLADVDDIVRPTTRSIGLNYKFVHFRF